MSDQGSAGQWRPASSQNGPYSESDEATGPLPAVSGEGGAPAGFPAVSGQQGAWSADEDAPIGGFPTASGPSQPGAASESGFPAAPETGAASSPQSGFPAAPEPGDPAEPDWGARGRRQRAPFEPPDGRFGPADDARTAYESADGASFGTWSTTDDTRSFDTGGSFGSEASAGAGDSFGSEPFASSGGSFGSGRSAGSEGAFGRSTSAEPEPSFEPTMAFEALSPEWDLPSDSLGPSSTGEAPHDPVNPSPAARPEPASPGSTPPSGSATHRVDPYDARDASHGYEVADPSIGSGMPHAPNTRSRSGVMGIGAAGASPEAEPFSFESLIGPEDGVPGGAAPNGRAPHDDTPPRPVRTPGETFSDQSATVTTRADRQVSAEDQAVENEFFAQDGNPAMWDKMVAPSGPPPQPGKPSSGNLRLPDWMREENGGTGAPEAPVYDDFEEEGRSKRRLLAGVGVVLVGLLAAGGTYFVARHSGSGSTVHSAAPSHQAKAPSKGAPKGAPPEPEKPLAQFKGVHTKPVGRITDQRAGLSYPKLGRPWQMQAKNATMVGLGFDTGQYAVTEKSGGQETRWARLLSGQLGGVVKNAYDGPGTERAAATQVADSYEARLYGYRHKKKVLASQSLNIDGHKGWLVGYYLTYYRPGVKTTGEIFTVALVDTGKKEPGLLLMSVPNTDKKLWPDVNYVMQALQVT